MFRFCTGIICRQFHRSNSNNSVRLNVFKPQIRQISGTVLNYARKRPFDFEDVELDDFKKKTKPKSLSFDEFDEKSFEQDQLIPNPEERTVARANKMYFVNDFSERGPKSEFIKHDPEYFSGSDDSDEEENTNFINDSNFNDDSSFNEDSNFNDFGDELRSFDDEVFHYKYTRLKPKSNVMSSILTKAKSTRHLKNGGMAVIEGMNVLCYILSKGIMPEYLFFCKVIALKNINIDARVKLFQVPYRDLKFWSELDTPPGLMGVFRMNKLKVMKSDGLNNIDLTIICDKVSNPGNLGAIIRSSAAIGVKDLFITEGCAFPYSGKVWRASSGAHLGVKITCNLSWTDIDKLIDSKKNVIMAESNDMIPSDTDCLPHIAKSDLKSSVRRARRKEYDIIGSLPVVNCFAGDHWKEEHGVVLVIGGESQGISKEGYDFCIQRGGKRVHIPMQNSVNSLNSAMSASVIGYELRRQWDLRQEHLRETMEKELE